MSDGVSNDNLSSTWNITAKQGRISQGRLPHRRTKRAAPRPASMPVARPEPVGPSFDVPLRTRPTERQAEALAVVSQHIAAKGYPPSIREIGVALGIASTNAVNDLLRGLETRGWIARDQRISRGIRVLP